MTDQQGLPAREQMEESTKYLADMCGLFYSQLAKQQNMPEEVAGFAPKVVKSFNF